MSVIIEAYVDTSVMSITSRIVNEMANTIAYLTTNQLGKKNIRLYKCSVLESKVPDATV
jgi:hypothetical protein